MLVWAYLAGAAACAGWLLLGHVLLWRVVRRAKRPESGLAGLFKEACEAVGVRGARVLVVSAPLRPVSCGLLRPTVLLGADDCAEPNRARLRQVLLHEAAHLRQRDAWGNALFNLAMPLLYFHPLYWVLRSRTSLAREMVADDIAASSTSRAAYAADLLELARARSGYRPAPLAAIGIFRSPSHFYRRMHMLMQRNIRLENRCSLVWKLISGAACAGVLFAASATLGVRAQAQESPKPVEIKQETLDRDLLDAKSALRQALADREAFLKQAKAGLSREDFKAGTIFDDPINQAQVDLQVARSTFGEKSPQVVELATRLRAMRDIEKQQTGERQETIAARKSELDSRVALAQKNLDEVQAAQQSVRSAAEDDDATQPSERELRAIRRRAELQAMQAREQADASRAQADQVRKSMEIELQKSRAEVDQLKAQLLQAEASMKQAMERMRQEQDGLAARGQFDAEGAAKHVDEQHAQAYKNEQVRKQIDQIIVDKLNKEFDGKKAVDIEELVRRTYLDVAGRLPTPDERIATEQALKKHLHNANQYIPNSPKPGTEPRREEAGRTSSVGAQLNAAVGGLRQQLDLVALANSYADAVGSIAAAREEFEASATDVHARSAAKAKLAAAEQKAHLLRSITEAALQQAKQEYDLARKRVEAGAAPPNDAIEAEGRMRILSLILQSPPDHKSSDLQGQ